MSPLIQLRQTTSVFLVALLLGCFALPPRAQAVSPVPDGGYPNFTTAEGDGALLSLTSGLANTAVGWFALSTATTGSFNTGVGAGALALNTGDENTAIGTGALLLNTTGRDNTAIGAFALVNNVMGLFNTAVGDRALQNNTASGNTAVGISALQNNTTATGNTAVGDVALLTNTTGSNNTANGLATLTFNTTGTDNTAIGTLALQSNTTGDHNSAFGSQALNGSTTGSHNIAVGADAGIAQTSGSSNIYIGDLGTNGESNVIAIGSLPTPGTSYSACFIGGIFNAISVVGTPVFCNSIGKLGTSTSSRRFKDSIKPMGQASETLLALKPVTFHYKKEIDPTGTSQFGLVAEDVEKVNPDLIVRDKEGKPYSVRYDQVNAMLLNEFLKEYRKVEQLEKQVAALSAGLQKVSAQLEVSKSARQVVENKD
jgi:hypothetical protein